MYNLIAKLLYVLFTTFKLSSIISYRPLYITHWPPCSSRYCYQPSKNPHWSSHLYYTHHLFNSSFRLCWLCSWRVSKCSSCPSCAVLPCKQLSWSQTARLQPLTKTAPCSSATSGQCENKCLRLVLSNAQMNMNAFPHLCRSRRGCSLCFRSLWISAPAPNPSTASLLLIFSICSCTSRVYRTRYSAVFKSRTSLCGHQHWTSPRCLSLPLWSRTPWQVY